MLSIHIVGKCIAYCELSFGLTVLSGAVGALGVQGELFIRAQLPPDRRPPRGLRGLAGQRVDAPSEARGAGGVGCCRCAVNEGMAAWRVCSHRPIGGHREACGAWPGFEPTRRAKLAARAASGRAGLAVAGDLAGLWQGRRSGGAAGIVDTKNRRPEGHRLSVRHGGLEPSTR